VRDRQFGQVHGWGFLRQDAPIDAATFLLLMDTRGAVAELMAECPKCGAITTQVRELLGAPGG
jgi:hypothetical protein